MKTILKIILQRLLVSSTNQSSASRALTSTTVDERPPNIMEELTRLVKKRGARFVDLDLGAVGDLVEEPDEAGFALGEPRHRGLGPDVPDPDWATAQGG